MLAAAEQRAEPLHRRGRLGLLIAALLRGFHLLVALFELAAERLQLAHRAVLVELHIARATPGRGAAERAGADHADPDHRSPDQRDDHRQDDRADDHHGGVRDRLVFRALHQTRNPEVQQIQAVEGGEDGKDAEQRDDLQHRGNPGRRVRVHRELQGLRAVLLTAEGRRQRVDDE